MAVKIGCYKFIERKIIRNKVTMNNSGNQICSKEQIYSKELAKIYDAIVYGKDEAYAETEELDFIIQNIHSDNTKRILDLGCGVGKFLIPLASMGYKMTGIDISSAVLSECENRLKNRNLTADLIKQSADKIDFSSQFDAVICMDSVICYLKEPAKILETLINVRKSLNPGGKLIIENRNLISDLDFYGEPNIEVVETETTKITYTSKNSYNKNSSLYYIDIQADIEKSGRSFSLSHSESLRFIPPAEMISFLKNAGFLPPEIELKKQIGQVEDLLETIKYDSPERGRIQKKLNYLFTKLSTMRGNSNTTMFPEMYRDRLIKRMI